MNDTDTDWGPDFWADAVLIKDDEDGRVFFRDGWVCWCPPGTNPGEADTIVRHRSGE